jgi:hypothetical protein
MRKTAELEETEENPRKHEDGRKQKEKLLNGPAHMKAHRVSGHY